MEGAIGAMQKLKFEVEVRQQTQIEPSESAMSDSSEDEGAGSAPTLSQTIWQLISLPLLLWCSLRPEELGGLGGSTDDVDVDALIDARLG